MELLIQLIAVLLAVVLAVVKSHRFTAQSVSEFELQRQAQAGEDGAKYELQRRHFLPLFEAGQRLKIAVGTGLLATLLVATHEWWIGLIMALSYIVAVEWLATTNWLRPTASLVYGRLEPVHAQIATKLAKPLGWFTTNEHAPMQPSIASKAELKQLLKDDTSILDLDEKSRLLAALDAPQLPITDAMVPRSQIVTVNVTETVGPLLLDRLHKAGHSIFVVIKKDLDHIKGLLYMQDLRMPHPDLLDVKDALRPLVHYLPDSAPLLSVVSASLQSGRQLFIVVDNQGNTRGLVTLRDALTKIMGTAPPDHKLLSINPKEV